MNDRLKNALLVFAVIGMFGLIVLGVAVTLQTPVALSWPVVYMWLLIVILCGMGYGIVAEVGGC